MTSAIASAVSAVIPVLGQYNARFGHETTYDQDYMSNYMSIAAESFPDSFAEGYAMGMAMNDSDPMTPWWSIAEQVMYYGAYCAMSAEGRRWQAHAAGILVAGWERTLDY